MAVTRPRGPRSGDDLPDGVRLVPVVPGILDDDPSDPGRNAQRALGDCWLIATIDALMETADGRTRLRAGIRWDAAARGYRVRLHDRMGRPRIVLVTRVLQGCAGLDDGGQGIVSLYEAAAYALYGWNGARSHLPSFGVRALTNTRTFTRVRLAGRISHAAVKSGGSAGGGVCLAGTRPLWPWEAKRIVPARRMPSGGTFEVSVEPDHVYEIVDIRGGLIGLRNPWGPGNTADGGGVFYVTRGVFDAAFFGVTGTKVTGLG